MSLKFKKIIVAHLSLNFLGGGEVLSLDLINLLTKMGYDVILATVDKTEWANINKIFNKKINIFKEVYIIKKLPKINVNFLSSLILIIFYIIQLTYLKNKFKNTLIINTCGEKINSISDITYLNAVPFRCSYKLPKIPLRRRVISIIYNLILTVLDGFYKNGIIICNSIFNKNLFNDFYNQKTVVIYPPIEINRLEKLSFKHKKDWVLIVSRYLSNQNLKIIPNIVKMTSQSKFILIGPITYNSKNILEYLNHKIKKHNIRNRIKILKNQPFDKYIRLLLKSKIIMRTLPYEPFGISIIEGMALDCIPIVPRNGGPWIDILDKKQGKHGFSYTNYREAAKYIDLVIKDDRLRRKIQTKNKKRVKKFDKKFFERSFISIIKKLEQKRRAE